MNLEQLQAKTDKELDRIAAVQILWAGISNVPSDEWNPTKDMNDAMRLAEIIFESKHLRLRLERGESDKYFAAFVTTPQSHNYVLAYDESAARAITIAAILAKLNEKG